MKNSNVKFVNLLLILIASSTIISCSNKSSMIVGKWIFDKVETYKNHEYQYTDLTNSNPNNFYQFNADGTGVHSYVTLPSNNLNIKPFNYSIIDDSLHFTYNVNNFQYTESYFIEELNSDKLIFSYSDSTYGSSIVVLKTVYFYFNRAE